jgi:hypothetical protein
MQKKGTQTQTEEVGECLKKRKRTHHKAKPVNFTILGSDSKLIVKLRRMCKKRGSVIFRSEIVRAGLLALVEMEEEQMIEMVCKVPKAKRGRRWPSKR